MTTKKTRVPRWVWPSVAGAVGTAVFLWSLTLRDAEGNKIIDSTAVAFATVIASVLIVILQRTRTADHELQPNSGSSTKDQMNRVEAMVKTLVVEQGDIRRDIGGIRQENRDDRAAASDDRRAAAEQFEELRGRIHYLEHPKEKP